MTEKGEKVLMMPKCCFSNENLWIYTPLLWKVFTALISKQLCNSSEPLALTQVFLLLWPSRPLPRSFVGNYMTSCTNKDNIGAVYLGLTAASCHRVRGRHVDITICAQRHSQRGAIMENKWRHLRYHGCVETQINSAHFNHRHLTQRHLSSLVSLWLMVGADKHFPDYSHLLSASMWSTIFTFCMLCLCLIVLSV